MAENLRFVLKYFVAVKYKQCEIYTRIWNVCREACFSQKNVYKWFKHGFATLRLSWKKKKQSMEWKHTDFLVKKKFQAQQSVKKIMLTVSWGMKGPITIGFFEKGATVNSAY